MRFVVSDDVAERAAAAFAEHERLIRERLAAAEAAHTGGTSVPGLLTTGDVDVHVRVAAGGFVDAVGVLSALYEPMHLDAWHAEGAFFAAPGSDPPVEVALTAIGSLDDLHHGGAWQRIAADPELRDRYNELKRAHEGGSREEYDAAKRAFFHECFRR